MLTKNETVAAVVDVYDAHAKLAEELRATQDRIMAVYKRWGDKLGCLPNYPAVDAAIDEALAKIADLETT